VGWIRTGPSLDAALLDAEDKNSARLDHAASFRVVETSSNPRNEPLSSGMDESKGVDGRLDVASEGRDIRVAAHTLRLSER